MRIESIEVPAATIAKLQEDVFAAMDAHRAAYPSQPDVLVSELYKVLTNRSGWNVPGWGYELTKGRRWQFQGNYFTPARRLFENVLESRGFELYVGKGRAFRVRFVEAGE